jgi:hypothetical protein
MTLFLSFLFPRNIQKPKHGYYVISGYLVFESDAQCALPNYSIVVNDTIFTVSDSTGHYSIPIEWMSWQKESIIKIQVEDKIFELKNEWRKHGLDNLNKNLPQVYFHNFIISAKDLPKRYRLVKLGTKIEM